jgi:short subunit dehydrogenase
MRTTSPRRCAVLSKSSNASRARLTDPPTETRTDKRAIVRGLLQSTQENVVTRFTTPFGFHTTAAEVVAGIDLTGKKAIVTGGAGGIGAETARALAAAGASVTLAVRRTDAAKTVVAELRQSTGNEAIDVRSLDLSDLRSVKAFTDRWEGPVHILVNNAGIMAVPELEKTAQGFELQFGTNFLGHFALTTGLHKVLAAANGARVVSVSSSGHLFSPVVFDDLNFDFIPYLRRLRAVQDCKRAVGHRHYVPLGGRRYSVQCSSSRSDCDRAPEIYGRRQDPSRPTQDGAARRIHVSASRRVSTS